MLVERRHADRPQKGSWLTFAEGEKLVPCTIRDISDLGASLTVESEAHEFPDTFNLAFDTGEPLWSFGEVEKNTVSSPAVVGDRLLVASSEKSSNLLLAMPQAEGAP